MAKLTIAPTKSNLLRLKDELKFSKQGYELLDQKRNILMVELMGVISKTKEVENKTRELLKKAFDTLENAILKEGVIRLEDIASAMNAKIELSLSHKKIMGVSVPIVKTLMEDRKPYYSLIEPSFWIDETIEQFKQVVSVIGELAQMRISLLRLSKEVKNTIRKVNSLEKIAIPDYEESINFISERIEEAEREFFVVLKSLKKTSRMIQT